ncbi:MAG: hypothetical protein PHS32_03140 [Rhodoferax sp.]|uniref:hypothetical protein n=1 Tax=Rhodoferax sp. TaxID=50421 RepID=UPI00260B2746|nr:hypothetical protein [Rhodoferax sp.]MDD5332717.1 hypothetical protein [Rhodoferax sp.]
MQTAQSKIASKGERIVLDHSKRHSTDEVHQTLFSDVPPGTQRAKTLVELKQGIRQRMQRLHARD